MKFRGLKRAQQIVQLFLLLNTNFTCKHFLISCSLLASHNPCKAGKEEIISLPKGAGNRIDIKLEMKGS